MRVVREWTDPRYRHIVDSYHAWQASEGPEAPWRGFLFYPLDDDED